jgi:hypothetical protein
MRDVFTRIAEDGAMMSPGLVRTLTCSGTPHARTHAHARASRGRRQPASATRCRLRVDVHDVRRQGISTRRRRPSFLFYGRSLISLRRPPRVLKGAVSKPLALAPATARTCFRGRASAWTWRHAVPRIKTESCWPLQRCRRQPRSTCQRAAA